jgi:hypothetical protein
MNEQDLRERMEHSVDTDLGETQIDPAADLRRGRTRLRRNRITTGFAAVTSVAAVAALGLQLVPASSADDQGTASAAKPAASPSTAARGAREQYTSRLVNLSANMLDSVLHQHVDPDGKHAPATPDGVAGGVLLDPSKKLVGVGFTQQWRQNGEVGQLDVLVRAGKHAQSKDAWCNSPTKLTCTTRTAPNGRPIVTLVVPTAEGGTAGRNNGLFVRYVRPDGQVVVVSVQGVTQPDVTLQQLIEAAIDPAMSLPK